MKKGRRGCSPAFYCWVYIDNPTEKGTKVKGKTLGFAQTQQGNSSPAPLILETAVVSTYLTQPLDSTSIMVKTLITNKVTAIFTMTLGKPIAYAMHALPTAVSRLIVETT